MRPWNCLCTVGPEITTIVEEINQAIPTVYQFSSFVVFSRHEFQDSLLITGLTNFQNSKEEMK